MELFCVLLISHSIVALMIFGLCLLECNNEISKNKPLKNKRKKVNHFIPYTPFKSIIPLSKIRRNFD